MARSPFKSSFACELCKWSENMCSTWPEGLIMIDRAYEGSDVGVVLGAIHLKDAVDALLPWFNSFWSHPKSKEISFFNKPFAFEGVAFHVVGVESRENKVYHSEVIIERSICPDS